MASAQEVSSRSHDGAESGAVQVDAAAATPGALAKRFALKLYEVPFLLAVVLFSFRNRMLPFDSLTRGEHVFFVGTDPYYHYRVVLATVANFPFTLRFDPFTHFPFGTGAGQFGSLFDVGAALFAMGLGMTGDRVAIGQALALWPAVLGAATFIPFYYLARSLTNRVGAVFATVALALIPGEWLVRSLAGYADHHVMEAMGLVVATLAAFVAVEAAHRAGDKLAWPLKDRRAVRWPLAAIGLGGLGVTFYFLAWPPAILLVGIFGVFLAITLFVDHVEGRDTRYIAWGGGGPWLIAGVLLLPTAETTQLNFNTFSLIQPLACLLLGVAAIAGHALSNALRARNVHRAVLPTGAAVAGFAAFFSLRFVMPNLYASLKWGASWVTGIGVKREMLTIAEAQPSEWAGLVDDYKLLLTVFVVSLVALAVAYAWKRRRADLLLLVMGLVLFQATRTQVRFNYYFAIVVALSYGWVAAGVADGTGLSRALARWFGTSSDEDDAPAAAKGKKRSRSRGKAAAALADERGRFKWHQPAALAAVAVLALPGLVIPDANAEGERAWTECTPGAPDYPAWVFGKCFGGPSHDTILWVEALDWMREGTPSPGFSVTDVHPYPKEGERYAYPDTAYGVLSWWDYGHWIQVEGERAPVANPFQQAAPFASCWLMETDPARAEGWLAAWGARERLRTDDTACPRVPVDATADGVNVEHPVRYVMVDDEMAAGKFGAITVWAGVQDRLYGNQRAFNLPDGSGTVDLTWTGEWYRDTMLSRLWLDDANDLEHYRLVHETGTLSLIGSVARVTDDGRGEITRFNALFNRYSKEQLEGFGMHANYQSGRELVPFNGNEYLYDVRVGGAVKTFEHVEGATVEGTGAAPGETVTAAVFLNSSTARREFSWTASTVADEDGSWSLTVPYATTDYVPVSEGGTDLTVRATGPAVFFTGLAERPTRSVEADIPDRAVLDGETVRVSLR